MRYRNKIILIALLKQMIPAFLILVVLLLTLGALH